MTKVEIDASGAPHSGIRSTSPPSKEVALAPCPFCGGDYASCENISAKPDIGPVWEAGCQTCESRVALGLDRDETIKAWNTRAATTAVGMREALANAIDSPTVAALAKVFDPRHQRPDKCYSEQIVEILSAALQSVQPPAGEGVDAATIEQCAKVADAETLKHSDWAQMAEHVLSDHVAACKQLASAMTAQEIAANIRALAALPPVSGDGR